MDSQFDFKAYPVLFVDDEPDILETFEINLGRDFRVLTARTGSEALDHVRREPIAVLVADQRMPEMHGLEVIRHALELRPDLVPIILTGFTDAESLVEAVNLRRIYRYLSKPWDNEDLRLTISRAVETYHLGRENLRLTEELRRANERLAAENAYLRDAAVQSHEIVGESAAIRGVLDAVTRVAAGRTTVLIEGETGTGKELVARAIHAASPRRDCIFVPVNCAALSSGILESELFGHRRGAFTGALADRKGLFEVADGGTLFLDEISETSVDLQARLLRVLQEGEIRRLGEDRLRTVDVRVVTATNRCLEDEVKAGRFRSDLYYRLRVYPIRVPPLRERRGDIPLLVDHFLRKYSRELKRPVPEIAADAVRTLGTPDYPGNVRELGNLIERALINSTVGEAITEAHIADGGFDSAPLLAGEAGSTLVEELARRERDAIERTLEACGNNKTHAARRLGLTYRGLLKKMQRLGMPTGGNGE